MKLYKFRTVNTNSLSLMANNQLWFSSFDDFNDPFEGAHIVDNHLPSEIFSKYEFNTKEEMGEEEYKELLSDIQLEESEVTNEMLIQAAAERDLDIYKSIVHESKIACFSLADKKRDPIKENLLWSHYANGLRGYCLVFDHDSLNKDINTSSQRATMPIKVTYQNIPNTLRLVDFVKSKEILAENDDNYVHTVTETIATKSEDWSYENELRILSLDNDNFHSYNPESLSEIIIGEKMTARHRKLVIDIAQNNNPK